MIVAFYFSTCDTKNMTTVLDLTHSGILDITDSGVLDITDEGEE